MKGQVQCCFWNTHTDQDSITESTAKVELYFGSNTQGLCLSYVFLQSLHNRFSVRKPLVFRCLPARSSLLLPLLLLLLPPLLLAMMRLRLRHHPPPQPIRGNHAAARLCTPCTQKQPPTRAFCSLQRSPCAVAYRRSLCSRCAAWRARALRSGQRISETMSSATSRA